MDIYFILEFKWYSDIRARPIKVSVNSCYLRYVIEEYEQQQNTEYEMSEDTELRFAVYFERKLEHHFHIGAVSSNIVSLIFTYWGTFLSEERVNGHVGP